VSVGGGSQRFGTARHLAVRFVGSLWPGGPSAADERWARQWCTGGEAGLWARMAGPDRRHAVAVARRVEAAGYQDRPVMAAALLHDVGKITAGLGTLGRVVATVAAMAAGHERASGWSGGGLGRRAGLYVRHDELGAALLAEAGSDELTVRWAREHHLPAERWSVAPDVGQALKAADDD